MASMKINISAFENPCRTLLYLFEGARHFHARDTEPLRVSGAVFGAMEDHGAVTARELLPDLAEHHPSFLAAIVAVSGSQGSLDIGKAALLFAYAAALVPANRADIAALARAAGYPSDLKAFANCQDFHVVAGQGGQPSAYVQSAQTGRGRWLHCVDGKAVRLIVTPPDGLFQLLLPSRRGEAAPSFGLAA